MNLCLLKHSDMEEHLLQYRGKVVLRGDNVKDDTGREQGASASHMTAAKKVLDTISRLPGMTREANDAVSAHTQVNMCDAP